MIISWLNYARSDIDQIQGDVFCSVTFSVSKSYGRTFVPSCVDTCIPECHCIRHRFCILRRFVRNRIEIQTGIQTSACSRDDIRPSMRLKILLRYKSTPNPTPLPISIRVNLVNKALAQIQRHRLLRHRPHGAQAQQAAKQQRQPFLHVLFLLLLRRPGAQPIRLHDAHYTLFSAGFQERTARFPKKCRKRGPPVSRKPLNDAAVGENQYVSLTSTSL